MLYSYLAILHTIIFVHSFKLQFETSCNSSDFIDLENLIGSLHRYAPGYGHLFVRDLGLTKGQQSLLQRYENIHMISSAYNSKERIPIINVKQEFLLNGKTLSNRSNANEHTHLDSIRKRFSLAVVIPFIQTQFNRLVDQLNLQKVFPPCQNQSHAIDLIFYHNEKTSSKLDKQIRRLRYSNRCFEHIRYFAADLTEEENRYPVGSAIMWQRLFINEQVNALSLRSHGYTHFFLMEPDTRPVRSYWLDAIVEHIVHGRERNSFIATQWWVVGSIYRGSEPIERNFFHINGNALYHLSLAFIEFLRYVSDEYPFDSKQSLGYDLDIFLYLFKNIDKGKNFWHKLQFSDFIQNCWHTGCNESSPDFAHNHPNTYLIHGEKVQQNILTHSSKNSNQILVILLLALCLVFLLSRRCRSFLWKLICSRAFLLRNIFQ